MYKLYNTQGLKEFDNYAESGTLFYSCQGIKPCDPEVQRLLFIHTPLYTLPGTCYIQSRDDRSLRKGPWRNREGISSTCTDWGWLDDTEPSPEG